MKDKRMSTDKKILYVFTLRFFLFFLYSVFMRYPSALSKLIAVLRKLPGVGTKTAERFAFQMITWQENALKEMGETISTIKEKVKRCPSCNCLIESLCPFCDSKNRQRELLCIVSSPKDLFLIEGTHEYKGLYHVLGPLLSPLEEKAFDLLEIDKLKKRIGEQGIKEVIFAFDATCEGDATALFLKEQLHPLDIATFRLALGLPMGSALDFIDGGTLARALQGRKPW